jgi:hypothetical protein
MACKQYSQIHQQSRFPLVGVHARVDCFKCHLSESFQRFDVIGTECYTCHSNEYAGTTAPNHISAGYSTNCEDCHNVFSYGWSGAGFNHEFFPLTQGHSVSDCKLCHVSDAKLSPVCESCHQQDFNSATNPNHVSAGFSNDCKMCHTTAPGWKPANFDHTIFPLTLGHDINDCTKCHIGGNYSNTSSECISCHQNDYNNTNNPAHSALNIPTSCVDCHTTAGWQPAKFPQHDALFPISSGKHKLSCDECHKTSNYKEFDCITCHNNKLELDDKHKDEIGYAYTSAKCYECHPQGLVVGGK